jgi:hypothetical protein
MNRYLIAHERFNQVNAWIGRVQGTNHWQDDAKKGSHAVTPALPPGRRMRKPAAIGP